MSGGISGWDFELDTFPKNTKIKYNGQEIMGVTEIYAHQKADGVLEVILHVIPDEVLIVTEEKGVVKVVCGVCGLPKLVDGEPVINGVEYCKCKDD